jgi:hypothetical protein
VCRIKIHGPCIANNNQGATVSSLSFRVVVVSPGAPVEMRRCRFMESDPPAAALPPTRLVGENRDEDALLGRPVVVEDRGLVDEAAIFGSAAPPFLDAL